MVGVSRAVVTTFAVRGVRRLLSQMIRTGSRPFCASPSLQVRSGSSVRTVPTPAMMAVRRFLVSWTCRRAASPVTQRDAPVKQAVFPSRVMAYFRTTSGRPVVM